MPHVIVKLWPGKSQEQKKQLAEQITRDVMSVLNYGEESVSVSLEEVKPQDWAEQVYKQDILSHPERLYKKPGYTIPSESFARAVGGFYVALLHRAADADGQAGFVSGLSAGTLSDAAVASMLLASDEFAADAARATP